MSFDLFYFNALDTASLNDYYEVEIDFQGRRLQLDLNFDSAYINEDRLAHVNSYLEKLISVHNAVIKAVYDDLETGDSTAEFLNYHIEELDKADLDTLTADADHSQSLEKQILSQLRLKRIGFYPESEEYFATLDFTIGEEISQYLLVVKMNSKQGLEEITMES